MTQNEYNFKPALIFNTLYLNTYVNDKIFGLIEDRINVQRVSAFYQLADIFNVSKLAQTTFRYIERCFTMIVTSPNFLELGFNFVDKILASSELNVTSEQEVLNAAEQWVNYNFKERSNFGKDLLLRVRLPLISDHALTDMLDKPYVLRSSSVFRKIENCVALINEFLENKNSLHAKNSSVYTIARYCSQNMFNILVSRGYINKTVSLVDSKDFNILKEHPQMTKWLRFLTFFFINGEAYVVGNKHYLNLSFERFSVASNKWRHVGNISEERYDYCACAIMNKIYIIGGIADNITDSCIEVNMSKNEFKDVNGMNKARTQAACAVFEGRIVISGGFINDIFLNNITNTVEAYDHVANKWSSMPSMIEIRHSHKSVSRKSKLFVIGGYSKTSEVFDSHSNKFSLLKPIPFNETILSGEKLTGVISIGPKLMIFLEGSSTMVCYDPENDEWSEESFELFEYSSDRAVMKIPKS